MLTIAGGVILGMMAFAYLPRLLDQAAPTARAVYVGASRVGIALGACWLTVQSVREIMANPKGYLWGALFFVVVAPLTVGLLMLANRSASEPTELTAPDGADQPAP